MQHMQVRGKRRRGGPSKDEQEKMNRQYQDNKIYYDGSHGRKSKCVSHADKGWLITIGKNVRNISVQG